MAKRGLMYADSIEMLTDHSGAHAAADQALAAPGRHDRQGRPPGVLSDLPAARQDTRCLLPHCLEAAGSARRITSAFLKDWPVGETESVLLVVSELVANAVLYARPPLLLHLVRDHIGSWVWVGVTDGGPTGESAGTAAREDDEHGRGLVIVDALAPAHGTRNHASGRVTHWAILNCSSPGG